MTQNKRVIGITGGSGSGKSYISARLKERGVRVLDCDVIAREVTQPGEACLAEIEAEFGNVLSESGELNRKKLAGIVFKSPEKLRKLNEITHKYILERIYKYIEESAENLVVVDGAVLIESGIKCDLMVGVLADRAARKKRITERDFLTEEEAESRISAQKDDEFYIENCDFIIRNDGAEFDAAAFLKRVTE